MRKLTDFGLFIQVWPALVLYHPVFTHGIIIITVRNLGRRVIRDKKLDLGLRRQKKEASTVGKKVLERKVSQTLPS